MKDYKVIWWSDFEQDYITSILNIEGIQMMSTDDVYILAIEPI